MMIHTFEIKADKKISKTFDKMMLLKKDRSAKALSKIKKVSKIKQKISK